MMAQEIKDLIAKIQAEGVKAAEDKAREIESQAKTSAAKILESARAEANKILSQANLEAEKIQSAVNSSLKQAGRDLLITLRKEINSLLDRIITLDVRQALSSEEIAKIITSLAQNAQLSQAQEIVITLSPKEKEKLEKGFLKKLVDETKKQFTLKPSEELSAGFNISFDAGKSHFDFTDRALADYIAGSIKPELNKIL